MQIIDDEIKRTKASWVKYDLVLSSGSKEKPCPVGNCFPFICCIAMMSCNRTFFNLLWFLILNVFYKGGLSYYCSFVLCDEKCKCPAENTMYNFCYALNALLILVNE